MKNDINKTTCPKCNSIFSFAENRIHQIKREYAPFWFFDAINQFENFNKVKCPSCGTEFIDNEVRLFRYFRSPYSVVAICLLFLFFAIVVLFQLKARTF